MPRRVKFDLVDPIAEPVVRAHARWILVREPTPLERRAGQERAERARARRRPAGTFTLERSGERPVLGEQVEAVERRRLVKNSSHNEPCAAGPRWTARCGVLSRPDMPAYRGSLRPCLTPPIAPRRRRVIMRRALRLVLTL